VKTLGNIHLHKPASVMHLETLLTITLVPATAAAASSEAKAKASSEGLKRPVSVGGVTRVEPCYKLHNIDLIFLTGVVVGSWQ